MVVTEIQGAQDQPRPPRFHTTKTYFEMVILEKKISCQMGKEVNLPRKVINLDLKVERKDG